MTNVTRRIFTAAVTAAAIALATGGLVRSAVADQGELRIAKQYGLGYLTLMVMEDRKIVERLAKEAGMPDLKVTWATFRSSDVMNDALLSSSVDFVCLGITGLGTIWARTRGWSRAPSSRATPRHWAPTTRRPRSASMPRAACTSK